MNETNLNPCIGCMQKYGNDINSVNSCCINTCGSFIGGGLDEIMKSDCGKKCIDCMGNIIKNTGKNPCQFWPSVAPQITAPPPFLKSLQEKKGDVPASLLLCRKKCDQMPNPNMCKEKCDMAASALLPLKENYNTYILNVNPSQGNLFASIKNNPSLVFFYIGIFVTLLALIFFFLKIFHIAIILLAVALIIFLYEIHKKQT